MSRLPTLSLPLTASAIVLAAFSAACAPQNAELTEGSYTAFLATSTSSSLVKGAVDPEDFDTHWTLDCREFENRKEELALQLENPLLDGKGCTDLVELGDSEWDQGESTQEGWLLEDGYQVVQEPLDPWRGEALVTTEGDLQVGFHHRLPGGEDFRFIFVINPLFRPSLCVADETGKSEPQELDGDWVGEWGTTVADVLAAHPDDPSYDMFREFPDGDVYFFTANSYQFNPDDPQSQDNPFWSLPNEWGAANGNGKYAEEFFSNRTIRYGEPILYSSFESTDDVFAPVQSPENVWYCQQGGENGEAGSEDCQNTTGNYEWTTRSELIARAEAVADETAQEMALVSDLGDGALTPFRPIVEDNLWRPDDGEAPGLDGWAELHYNWVIIDKGSDVVKGGNVSGAFQLVMDGSTSTSRYFVSGKFDVERIKGDIWSNKDLQELKAEEAAENGTPLCEFPQ